MKNLSLKAFTVSLLTLATLLGFSAQAQSVTAQPLKKEETKINFHQMIVQTSAEKNSLSQQIGTEYSEVELDMEEVPDVQKVVDFIDVEVQWGGGRKMVDRRFNSVGQPQFEETKPAAN